MKKIISLILLLTVLMCSASVGAYAVTMYAPDGRTISVHDTEVSAYKAVGWYDVPVCKIYDANGIAVIINQSELPSYQSQGWKQDYTVTLYAADGRQTSVWSTEMHSYLGLGWYSEPICKIYSPINYDTAVIYKSELQTYLNLGWEEDGVVTMYSVDGATTSAWKTQTQAYRNVGWYDVPVVRMYANGGRICVVAASEINQYRNVGWYPLYAFASGNSANEIISTFGTLLDYSDTFNAPVYLTNSAMGIDLGFVFASSGSTKTVKSGFAYFRTIFPYLVTLAGSDGTLPVESLSSYFGTQLQYVNGEYTFNYDGHTFHLSVNAYGNITMDSICAYV